MSKRKCDNGKMEENCWTKFDRDSKGQIKDLYIRQLRAFDDPLEEDGENGTKVEDGKAKNGTKAPPGDFEPGIQKLAFFQGKSWVAHKRVSLGGQRLAFFLLSPQGKSGNEGINKPPNPTQPIQIQPKQ